MRNLEGGGYAITRELGCPTIPAYWSPPIKLIKSINYTIVFFRSKRLNALIRQLPPRDSSSPL